MAPTKPPTHFASHGDLSTNDRVVPAGRAHDAARAVHSIHLDYVNYYLLTPVAVDRTIVESEWMFHPDNERDPTFNPRDAIEVWDVTNRQDWDICERSQLGILSRRYQPGPYSPRESIPAAWDAEYLRIMDCVIRNEHGTTDNPSVT